jgi:hypothetical protein
VSHRAGTEEEHHTGDALPYINVITYVSIAIPEHLQLILVVFVVVVVVNRVHNVA